MAKTKKELLADLDAASKKLERWFRRLNRAVTEVNETRRRVKRLSRQLVEWHATRRRKPGEGVAGRVPIIGDQRGEEVQDGR